MAGAPSLYGAAGRLIAVLDACLKDGFGTVTVGSLVVAGGVATATVSTGHGFSMLADGIGPVIRMAGATPTALNGDVRLTSVPSSTTFTFLATGISDQIASGTITAKIAPLDWAKTYSGTNLAVYSRTDANATAMKLRIDDTFLTVGLAVMYEAMTDVNTGTNPGPTSGAIYVGKSTSADTTARGWRLFGDSRMFYFFSNYDSTWYGGMAFGDINSYRDGDQYHCLLSGGQSTDAGFFLSDFRDTTANTVLIRSGSQLAGAIGAARYSHRKFTTSGNSSAAVIAPNPVSNKFHVWPIEVWDSTSYPRGILPGCYCPLHYTPHGLVVGTLYQQQTYDATRRFAMDLVGPWR